MSMDLDKTDLTDGGLCYVTLSVCEMDGEGDLKQDTEKSWLVGYRSEDGVVRTYESEEAATVCAKKALDEAIGEYGKRGYGLRCAPKTIDVDNHNWRRIARVGKPGEPSVCLQAVVDAIAPYFDGWIY